MMKRADSVGLSNEFFEVGYLDSGLRLVRDGVETLEQGTVDRAAVYPRRVVEAALRRGAAAMVFAHNHPNGDVRPSDQDKVLTRALVLAGNKATSESGGGTPVIPRHRHVVQPAQFRGDPFGLLVPAESEQDFRQHRPDQGREVVVQQLVQRPFLAALRPIEEREPRCKDRPEPVRRLP